MNLLFWMAKPGVNLTGSPSRSRKKSLNAAGKTEAVPDTASGTSVIHSGTC